MLFDLFVEGLPYIDRVFIEIYKKVYIGLLYIITGKR